MRGAQAAFVVDRDDLPPEGLVGLGERPELIPARAVDEHVDGTELGDDALLTFTRSAPSGWSGHTGRLDGSFIAQAAGATTAGVAFICGSNGFVESAGELLLDAGFEAGQIRTERFGPT